MNFLFAARLLNEGHVLKRKSWNENGYVFKDEKDRLQFFDHNEPHIYQPTIEDTLADDWTEEEKDRWTIVSVSYDFELIQNKKMIHYHICSRKNDTYLNNCQIAQDELASWARCVEFDMIQTAKHLNEQDVAQVKMVMSA